MTIAKASLGGLAMAALIVTGAAAQGPPAPTPPAMQTCKLSAKDVAAGRALVLKFFTTTGDERVALADPAYIQHNPAFKKRAIDNKVSDFEEFRNSFGSAALAARAGGAGPRAGGPPPAGAAGNNMFEVVTTECDTTTVIHKNVRPDPTAPGQTFEAFSFDTFKVKNGKLIEHWDGAVINPPAGPPPSVPPAGGPPPR